MFDLSTYILGLAVVAVLAVGVWLLSLPLRNVSIVDSAWSLMFVVLAVVYAVRAPTLEPRASLILLLLTVWALRLAIHITWRNRGHGEDRRYQAIRARNQPNFEIKSLYLVFLLQAALAWIISLPLLGGIMSRSALGPLDIVGAALWLIGFVFEAGGDWQLTRFKADQANRGKVMDQGFWRYTRHPNYFGDFTVWWGLYLVAAAGGAWWSFPGPS